MPNDCENKLRISHQDKNMIMRLINALNEEKFLEEFIPTPSEEVEKDWYNWRCENWGTKWDIYDMTFEVIRDDTLYLSFYSAWSPPIEAYFTLIKMGFDINAWYYESGMCFCGIFKNGENMMFDTCDTPEEVKKIFNLNENNTEEN